VKRRTGHHKKKPFQAEPGSTARMCSPCDAARVASRAYLQILPIAHEEHGSACCRRVGHHAFEIHPPLLHAPSPKHAYSQCRSGLGFWASVDALVRVPANVIDTLLDSHDARRAVRQTVLPHLLVGPLASPPTGTNGTWRGGQKTHCTSRIVLQGVGTRHCSG